MKKICALLTGVIVISQTTTADVDYDYLGPRIWESSNGQKLTATLVKLSKGKVTLKRKKDNKVVSLPLNRLSEDENEQLEETLAGFSEIQKSAIDRSSPSSPRFVGFTEPGEKMWELAHRFGVVRDTWNVVTQSNDRWWYSYRSHGSDRILKIVPQRFKRISATVFLINGEYISVKIQVRQGEKLNISGEKLVFLRPGRSKIVIAQRKIPYTPRLHKAGLIGCESEKMGVREQLVITIEPIIDVYRR